MTTASDSPRPHDVPAAHDPANDDPYREPGHATVDDWLGQRVERDNELAERLLEETGGDEAEAARRFAEESHEGEDYHRAHEQRRD